MLVATQVASSSGSVDAPAPAAAATCRWWPPRRRAGRRAPARARSAPGAARRAGARAPAAKGERPTARPHAQARGDALRRGRRGAPRVVGRARGQQRPHDAVLLQRERGGELLGDGGNDPARAVGLPGAQARSLRAARRLRVASAVGASSARRVGAGALAQRAQQSAPPPPAPGAARRRASATSAVTRVQVAQGRRGQGVVGRSGGSRKGHAGAQAASRPFARGQERLCGRLAFAMLPRRDPRLHLARRRAHRALRARRAGRGAGAARRRLRAAHDRRARRRRRPPSSPAPRAVHDVPTGRVDEVAGDLLDAVDGDLLVALGGGRVVDVAKALAAARGADAAAIPTTLSAAEMTRGHRHARGVDPATPRVRAADRAQRSGAVRLAARRPTSRRRPPTRSATRSRAR